MCAVQLAWFIPVSGASYQHQLVKSYKQLITMGHQSVTVDIMMSSLCLDFDYECSVAELKAFCLEALTQEG